MFCCIHYQASCACIPSFQHTVLQVNNTIVPFVLRRTQGRVERLVPLSVLRHAAGLLGGVEVPNEQPTTDECAYLNASCRRANVSFTFNQATKFVGLDVVARMCPKTAMVSLPKGDPFGNAKYVGEQGDGKASQGQQPYAAHGSDAVPTVNISHGFAGSDSYTAVQRLRELSGSRGSSSGALAGHQQQQQLVGRQQQPVQAHPEQHSVQLQQQQQQQVQQQVYAAQVPGNAIAGQRQQQLLQPFVGGWQGSATMGASIQQQQKQQQQQQQLMQQQMLTHQQQQQLMQQHQQQQQHLLRQQQLMQQQQQTSQHRHHYQQQHRAQVMAGQPPQQYRSQLPVGVPPSSQTNGSDLDGRRATSASPATHATSIHQLRLEAYVNGRPPEQRGMTHSMQQNVAPQMSNIPVPQQISWPQTTPTQPPTTKPLVLGQIVEMSSGANREVCNNTYATSIIIIFALC